jgi:hypothetical protein
LPSEHSRGAVPCAAPSTQMTTTCGLSTYIACEPKPSWTSTVFVSRWQVLPGGGVDPAGIELGTCPIVMSRWPVRALSTRSQSVPMRSRESTTAVSDPEPQRSLSLPAPPLRRSSPGPPNSRSFPAPP